MVKNNFDGLRLVAAGLVMAGHMATLSGRVQPKLAPFLYLDRLGVLMFFAISGYLVATSWANDPHAWRFLQRRMLRVWPAFAVVVVVTLAAAVVAGVTEPGDGFYLTKLLFLDANLQAFPGNPKSELNGSLWTVPLEVACYLALLAFGLLTRRWGNALLTVAVAWLAVYGLWFAAHDDPPLLYFGSFFLVGAAISRCPQVLTLERVALACLVGVLFGLKSEMFLALVVIIPMVTLYVGTQAWPGLRSAGRGGDLSYGVYLWAFPVQQTMVWLLGKQAHYAVLLTASAAVTLVLAWLSWHLIEKPALKLKPRHLDRQQDQEHVGGGVAGVKPEQQRLALGLPVVDAGSEVVAHH